MPRDGAIIFSDLIRKLDVLRVLCDKCRRDGCYGLSRLNRERCCRRCVLVVEAAGPRPPVPQAGG
jgi:hypothetical protein